MTGKYRFDPHFPVTKATKGLLVVPRTSALVRYETLDVERMLNQARVACCQCVQCTLACSRNLVGYDLEPHRITYFLMNLAGLFHGYYNKHKVLTEDKQLSAGRLYLILAVQKVIKNGLALLGVSAPERM